MKFTARVYSRIRTALCGLAILVGSNVVCAQNEPILVPDVVDYQKLIPILPDAPPGWTADKPEGSTEDAGGFKITNVHRDYQKGEGTKAVSAAITVVDLVGSPEQVKATTDAWKTTSETLEGYGKSVSIDGNPG